MRTALQALVGCAGAAAGGGSCTSAASGAAASVVLNALINSATGQDSTTFVNGAAPDPKSLADQQARTALIATLVGAISSAAGLNAQSAVNAAVIETERNGINPATRQTGSTVPGKYKLADFSSDSALAEAIAAGGGIEAFYAYSKCIDPTNVGASCVGGSPAQTLALSRAADRYAELDKFAVQQDQLYPALGAFRLANADLPADVATGIYARAQQDYAVLVAFDIPLAERRATDAAVIFGIGSPQYRVAQANLINLRSGVLGDTLLGQPAGTFLANSGVRSYRSALAEARTDAAVANVAMQFACLGVCIPGAVLSLVGLPAALGAGGVAIGAKFGGGILANTLATGVLSGGLNVGVEYGTNYYAGQPTTVGGATGAFASGFVFGGGIVRFINPANGLVTTVRNGAVLGGASAGAGNFIQQQVDIYGTVTPFSLTDLGVSTASGFVGGSLVAPIGRFVVPGNPFGVNRFDGTYNALETKLNNGIIQNISMTSAVKGAIGAQVGELPKTLGQAAIDAQRKKLCLKRPGQCK